MVLHVDFSYCLSFFFFFFCVLKAYMQIFLYDFYRKEQWHLIDYLICIFFYKEHELFLLLLPISLYSLYPLSQNQVYVRSLWKALPVTYRNVDPFVLCALCPDLIMSRSSCTYTVLCIPLKYWRLKIWDLIF